MSRKSLAYSSDAGVALATHNATYSAAPAASAHNLGAEVRALEILQEHGPGGFDQLTRTERMALISRLLTPVTGFEEPARAPRRKRTQLASWSETFAYLRTRFESATREYFCVVFLDKKNQHIADEVLGEGTVDHAPVYPREIMRRGLELGASALILVHNHPSGDPAPSHADIEMTRLVVAAAKTIGFTVHDHLIVGKNGIVSLKSEGLF